MFDGIKDLLNIIAVFSILGCCFSFCAMIASISKKSKNDEKEKQKSNEE